MCTGILSFVTQYDRYYCFRCNAYPPEGVFMETKVEAVPSTPPAAIMTSDPTVVVIEPSTPQEATTEERKPEEAKPEEAQAIPVEVPAEPAPQRTEVAEEEIPREETASLVEKPKLIRQEILEAKKPVLMDLCKAYNLDPTGTKEQLRERLLSYLDELEAGGEPEEVAEGPAEEPTAEVREDEVEEVTPTPPPAVPVVAPAIAAPSVEAEPRVTKEVSMGESPVTRPSVISLAPAMVPEHRAPPPVIPATVAPSVVAAPQVPEAAIPESRPITPARVEHPCPTCGRALTYVPQYNRWYCYSCRAYAPAAKSKFACPNCGSSLRWISQYERWWCDACRRYAPADLPKPERTGIVAIPAAVPRTAVMPAATVVHRHRSPGSGIGLVGFGMLLFVVHEILVDLPAVLSVDTGVVLAPDVAFGLRFFAFLFVAVGAIMGLYAVRDHR